MKTSKKRLKDLDHDPHFQRAEAEFCAAFQAAFRNKLAEYGLTSLHAARGLIYQRTGWSVGYVNNLPLPYFFDTLRALTEFEPVVSEQTDVVALRKAQGASDAEKQNTGAANYFLRLSAKEGLKREFTKIYLEHVERFRKTPEGELLQLTCDLLASPDVEGLPHWVEQLEPQLASAVLLRAQWRRSPRQGGRPGMNFFDALMKSKNTRLRKTVSEYFGKVRRLITPSDLIPPDEH